MTRRNATRPIREAQAFDVDLTPPRRPRLLWRLAIAAMIAMTLLVLGHSAMKALALVAFYV